MKNKISIELIIMTLCIIVIAIVLGIGIVSAIKGSKYEDIPKDDKPKSNTSKVGEVVVTNNRIDLSKPKERLVVDKNLTIDFVGKQDEQEGEGFYTYTATIIINGEEFYKDFFYDSNNPRIWSSNYAASFRVEKINGYYFIISSVAKQFDGDYVLIIDSNGIVEDAFDDVKFSLDKKNNRYEVRDCTTGEVDEECFEMLYNISDG